MDKFQGCPTPILGQTTVLSMGALPGSAAVSLGPVLNPALRCSPRRIPHRFKHPQTETQRETAAVRVHVKRQRAAGRTAIPAPCDAERTKATDSPSRGCGAAARIHSGIPAESSTARCEATRLRRPLSGSRPAAGPRGRRDRARPCVRLCVCLCLCVSVCVSAALRGAVCSTAASLFP